MPTVAKAEILSNSTSNKLNLSTSTIVISRVAIITAPK